MPEFTLVASVHALMTLRALAAQTYCSFSSFLFFTLRGEPDLWRKDLTASVKLWIDVSQPDEKRMRRACGRADEVYVYVYGGQGINLWWKKVATDVAHCANLTVVQLPLAACREMAQQAERNMKLNCTIQEGQIWLAHAQTSVQV